MTTTESRPFEPAPGVIRDVPLELIYDSPAQELEVYDPAYIAELGASIKALGYNHTPILLRPRPNGLPGYESAFGHCRKRGCAWAGLPTCRAEIREMTDLEVEQAQLSENLNRRTASPLEEATRFDRLMRIHKLSAQQLMENFGKSKGYVYGRLSLLKLSDTVRQAMAAGLQTETALAIARHDNERLQQLAIAKVRLPNGDWMPTLQAKRLLNEAFTIRLEQAPFDLKDEKLLKRAGSCAECPNLAANCPGLADLPADTCVDTDCYEMKLQEHWAHVIMQLQDDGHDVLQEEDEIRALDLSRLVPFGTSLTFDGHQPRRVSELIEAWPEDHPRAKLTYVAPEGDEPRGYIAREDLANLARALGLQKAPAAQSGVDSKTDSARPAKATDSNASEARDGHSDQAEHRGKASGQDWAFDPFAGWSAEERVAGDPSTWKEARAQVLTKLLSQSRTVDELRMMAKREVLMADGDLGLISSLLLGVDEFSEEDMLSWCESATPDQLSGMLAAIGVDYFLLSTPWTRDGARRRLQLAETYGIRALDFASASAAPTQAHQEQQANLDSTSGPDRDDEDDEEEVSEPAVKPAAKGSKNPPVRYRNPATGETWSGRGLQPKWLKAAIAAGNKLTDYAVEAATA